MHSQADRSSAIRTIRDLRRDINSLLEMRCETHGTPGAGPAFTLCALALIACEVAGRLLCSSSKPLDGTREALRRVAGLTGCERYDQLSGPLFLFFRHGIAHAFSPIEHEVSPGGTRIISMTVWYDPAEWQTGCLQTAEGRDLLDSHRRGDHHLRVERVPPDERPSRQFKVFPQVLGFDVNRLLAAMEDALERGEGELWSSIEPNLASAAKRARQSERYHQLTDAERELLEQGTDSRE